MAGKFRPMMTADDKKSKEKMDKKYGVSSIDEPMGYYPQEIRFKEYQLPELKSWEVGKEYNVSLVVKMKSLKEKKKGFSGEFEIVAVKAEDGKMTKEQKKIVDFMS